MNNRKQKEINASMINKWCHFTKIKKLSIDIYIIKVNLKYSFLRLSILYNIEVRISSFYFKLVIFHFIVKVWKYQEFEFMGFVKFGYLTLNRLMW